MTKQKEQFKRMREETRQSVLQEVKEKLKEYGVLNTVPDDNMKKEVNSKKIMWNPVNRFTEGKIHTKVHYSTRANALRHIKNCVVCFKYEAAIPARFVI